MTVPEAYLNCANKVYASVSVSNHTNPSFIFEMINTFLKLTDVLKLAHWNQF